MSTTLKATAAALIVMFASAFLFERFGFFDDYESVSFYIAAIASGLFGAFVLKLFYKG